MKIEEGKSYEMPRGKVNIKITKICPPGEGMASPDFQRVWEENLTGKRVGHRRWESLTYLNATVVRELKQ